MQLTERQKRTLRRIAWYGDWQWAGKWLWTNLAALLEHGLIEQRKRGDGPRRDDRFVRITTAGREAINNGH